MTIELTSKTEADKPLTITIGTDTAATKEQLQTFITSYNTLQDTLQKLTKSGSGDGEERGAFAGDATMASLDRELNDVLRTQFGGKRIPRPLPQFDHRPAERSPGSARPPAERYRHQNRSHEFAL